MPCSPPPEIPRAYAGCLIDLLEKGCARRGWTMAQAAVARARDASIRIARILRVGPSVTTRIGRIALGAAASLALACTGIALCAPQFVAFVPIEPTSTAQLNKPLVDNIGFAPSPSAVVNASFHPARKATPALPTAARRHRTSHAVPLRQASLTHNRIARNPVVMTRVTEFVTTNQPAPAPMMLIFRTAQLRTTGSAIGNARTLQSSENPALQIQVVQIVDPATGIPVQILEIMLVLPQQPGSPSQSI